MARRVPAGEMRHVLILQKNSGEGTYGTYGEVTDSWSDVSFVRGRVTTLRGQEGMLARQLYPKASFEVVVDYFPEVNDRYRFKLGSRVLNIEHYDDVDQEHLQLVCYCSESQGATT